MKTANCVMFFLGCWFFLSGGNMDERILSSIQLQGLMLAVLMFFAALVFVKGVELDLKIFFFPILFFYMFVVSLFFGGELQGAIKVIVFSLVVMMASYLACKISIEDFLKTVVVSLFILLLANIFAAVLYPNIGLEIGYFMGDWKGIFDQKNSLGRLSSLVIVATILLIICSKEKAVQLYSILMLIAAIMVAFNAGSRTGLATAALVSSMTIFFCLLYNVLKRDFPNKKYFILIVFIEFVLVMTLIMLNINVVDLYSSEDGISIFGNFISLTGRLTIWDFAIENMHGVQVWLGYGLDNFWTLERFSIIGPMQGMGTFYPADSHNGYIDILIQGGVIGAIFYFLSVLFVVKAFFESRLTFNEYVITFTFVILFLVSNLTESYTTKSTNVIHFLYVYSVAYLFLRKRDTSKSMIVEIKPLLMAKKLFVNGINGK